MKKLIKFIVDFLFTAPTCEECGGTLDNVGGGGISPEPLYVCLDRKCKNNSCI